jgi:hypothetical protein
MMGALHKARSPPMELNAVRKLAPLQMQSKQYIYFSTQFHYYHSGMQWASSTAMITRCFFTYGEEKISRHRRDVANSGDMNTATVLHTCVNDQWRHDISYQIGIYHLLHRIHWYYLGRREWLKFQYFGLCSPAPKTN